MILILSGSPRGREQSLTLRCAEAIAKHVGLPWETVSPATWNVRPCTGCGACFSDGACAFEQTDDVGKILSLMKMSDAMILASPVYAGGVPGQLKCLFDRMSTRLHTMPLIGKPAAVLAVSSRSHTAVVRDTLTEFLEFMGASVVAGAEVISQRPAEGLEEAGEALKHALTGAAPLPISARTASWFRHQHTQYAAMMPAADLLPHMLGEALAWRAEGNDAFDSIEEAMEAKRRLIL